MGDWIAAAIFILIISVPLFLLSIPLLMIWTHHRRKMEEMRLQRDLNLGEAIKAEFASVRAEIHSLRDTSMQYDLSFDTSLQQMERRLAQAERADRPAITTTEETARNSIYFGR